MRAQKEKLGYVDSLQTDLASIGLGVLLAVDLTAVYTTISRSHSKRALGRELLVWGFV